MKILIVLFTLLSVSAFGSEIKLSFNKADALVGEVLKAQVEGYDGSVVENKRIGDDLYIVSLDGDHAEIIFLKKLNSNVLKWNEESSLVWSPINLKEIDLPKEISLIDQYFNISSNRFVIIVGFIFLFLLLIGLKFYFSYYRPLIVLKKKRQAVKDELFSANGFEDITDIWKRKHEFINMFPSIEEAFLKFEVDFYKIAFSPNISPEDKKNIEKRYQFFLDQVRGGSFGV